MQENISVTTAVVRYFQTQDAQDLAFLEALPASSPAELMRLCVTMLQAADAVLEEEGRQLAGIFQQHGTPIVCGKGCTGCCRQLVLCRPFEAENIRAYLEAHPPKLNAFRKAYPVWDKATADFRHSYLAWAEACFSRGEDDGSHSCEDFRAPCPFLNDEQCCDIYPVRPYGCRTCIAVDPACAVPGENRVKPPYIHFSLHTGHHKARTALNAMLLRRCNADTKPVAMPDMLAALCGL